MFRINDVLPTTGLRAKEAVMITKATRQLLHMTPTLSCLFMSFKKPRYWVLMNRLKLDW